MATRAEYRRLLEDSRDQWRAASGLGREYQGILAGEWTFRDVVAHLNGWREWSCRRLEAAASGFVEPNPPWPAGMGEETVERVDAVNDWFVTKRRPAELNALMDESDQQYDRLLAALNQLADADLATKPSWLADVSDTSSTADRFPLSAVIDGCLEHWREHHAQFLKAFGKPGAEEPGV